MALPEEHMNRSDTAAARLAVARGALKEALILLTHDQRQSLLKRLSGLFADAQDLWLAETRTDFQQALMDEYNRIRSEMSGLGQATAVK